MDDSILLQTAFGNNQDVGAKRAGPPRAGYPPRVPTDPDLPLEEASGSSSHDFAFVGEGFTAKDARHCVNSVSMRFYPNGTELPEVIE